MHENGFLTFLGSAAIYFRCGGSYIILVGIYFTLSDSERILKIGHNLIK